MKNIINLIKSKKGIAFTLIAIILSSLLFITISAYSNTSLRDRSSVLNDRINSVDYFIDDLEKDINRGVYIAGFRTLLGIQQYITSKGDYLDNADDVFSELIINGTINGTYMSVMDSTELSVWFDRIAVEADKIGLDVNYTIIDVDIYHRDPFYITIDLHVLLNISDQLGTAYFERDQVIPTDLEIDFFEDPIYTINTFGRVINVIRPSNYTQLVDGTDTSNLKSFIDQGMYINTNSSPSYLMRLEGNLSNSTYGIESIVNLRLLEDASLTIINKSCLDYIYFSTDDPVDYQINYTYNWLNIDNESNHLAIYDVENITI